MNPRVIELREVVTKLVPLLAGKGLRVTQIGSNAYVRTNLRTRKPELVNIPMIPDNAQDDFIQAIQGFIDHEIAHVLLGHTDLTAHNETKPPRDIREVEAEGTAMLCLAALDLPGMEYCRGYIQSWIKGNEIPEKSAKNIMKAADQILKAGRS